MKNIFSKIAGMLCSKFIYYLHNRNFPKLSREEIRQFGISFSFCAEDIVVMQRARQLKIDKGIYVDVGAFDPIFCSNTLLLSKNGWSGINIDVDLNKIEKFQRLRPLDCNIVAAVSDLKEKVHFATYTSSSWNRIVEENCINAQSKIGENPLKVIQMETKSLTEIIDESQFANKEIAYLDVDCEGYDFKVLKSLDFEKYKPRIISFEARDSDERDEIAEFLKTHNYKISDIVNITTICVIASKS